MSPSKLLLSLLALCRLHAAGYAQAVTEQARSTPEQAAASAQEALADAIETLKALPKLAVVQGKAPYSAGGDAHAGMFGIDVEGIPQDRIGPQLDAIKESGASWIRILAMWRWIELNSPQSEDAGSGPGNLTGEHDYNWSWLDAIVDAALARGLNVYLNNIWPPPWTNGANPGCTPFNDISCGNIPQNPGWYEDFVYNEAVHFQGRVHYYGVWNEPNDGHEFNYPNDGAYLNSFMLNYVFPARRALAAADPSAKLVGPELSMGTGVPDGGASWDKSWLEPILKYFPGTFDVISIHNHSNSHNNAKENAETAYRLIQAYGSTAEFWMTEYGVDVCNVSESKQSRQIERIYVDTINRPWWTKTFYYSLVDLDGKTCGSGLFTAFDEGFAPRPAYQQYRALTGR